MSDPPSRAASPRPPRPPPRNFTLDAGDSEDDFFGGPAVDEIVPAESTNVFADPLTPPSVDPYRFPISFRDSGSYVPVPQQQNSPRILRNLGPPPSSYPEARSDSPASISRNGHTEESYFARPGAPFMRSGGKLSESSRNNSANFTSPAPWNTGSGSRFSFGGSASMAGHNDSTIGTTRYRTRRKGVSMTHIRSRLGYQLILTIQSFTSNMLKYSVDKPWLSKADPWATFGQWLTRSLFLLGVCAAAALCYFGFTGIDRIGNLCLVMEDNFDTLDTDTWRREVAVGGFGNGEFQWYTNDDENL